MAETRNDGHTVSDGKHENDSKLHSGLSRKRTYQGLHKSISGSLKKVVKKTKLDEIVENKNNDSTFRYGNYNRYYGYRNENKQLDKRLSVFKKEWFENKSCLDIGSNVGHVSLWIGKHFNPERIRGVDIDCELVKAAKKNIVHYIDENYVSALEESFHITDNVHANLKEELQTKEMLTNPKENLEGKDIKNSPNGNTADNEILEKKDKESHGDLKNSNTSMLTVHDEKHEHNDVDYDQLTANDIFGKCDESTSQVLEEKTQHDAEKEIGKVLIERLNKNCDAKSKHIFPYNVSFILENYVPAGSGVLKYVKEEFHTILCLSVTKWIQLNFGDSGLKFMFQKIHKQLYSGGILLLEPQHYKSYKRRKNLTPAVRKNYDSMKLMPDQFIDYLLSSEVGFSKCDQIDITLHEKQGFQRPIYMLTKE